MIDRIQKTDAFEWLGVTYRIALSTKETAGAMSIVDCLAPVGSSPPRHVHQDEDECFVVLTGHCEFWLEGKSFTRKPGETAFIPRGIEHTFRVIGDMPSRHLVVLTPGGFEQFFREMAKGHCRLPEDMPTVKASAARHGLTFTGPPLGDF